MWVPELEQTLITESKLELNEDKIWHVSNFDVLKFILSLSPLHLFLSNRDISLCKGTRVNSNITDQNRAKKELNISTTSGANV